MGGLLHEIIVEKVKTIDNNVADEWKLRGK